MEKNNLTPAEREHFEKLRTKFPKWLTTMGEYRKKHPRSIKLEELLAKLPEKLPYLVDLYLAGEILWEGRTSDVVYLILPDEFLKYWGKLNPIFTEIYSGLVWAGRFRFDHYGDELPLLKIYSRGKKVWSEGVR